MNYDCVERHQLINRLPSSVLYNKIIEHIVPYAWKGSI